MQYQIIDILRTIPRHETGVITTGFGCSFLGVGGGLKLSSSTSIATPWMLNKSIVYEIIG